VTGVVLDPKGVGVHEFPRSLSVLFGRGATRVKAKAAEHAPDRPNFSCQSRRGD
jgi:hypothetical protein